MIEYYNNKSYEENVYEMYIIMDVTNEVDEIVEKPAAEEPAVEEPAVEEPAVEEPAVEEPAAEEPAVEEPAAEEPAAEEPAVEEPAVEEHIIITPSITVTPPVVAKQPEQPQTVMQSIFSMFGGLRKRRTSMF